MARPRIDVAVIGGGPAGSVLAHRIAVGGANVVIFDPSHPREKPCGGGISARARVMFPELEELVPEGRTGTGLRLVSPSGRLTQVSGSGETFAIDRETLDHGLLKRAIDAGAEHRAEKVIDCEETSDGWLMLTSSGEYSARLIVGADGVFSVVRHKTIGAIPKQHLGFGAHMLVEDLNPPSALLQFFGDRRGYAWVFNRKRLSSIGVGMPMLKRSGWRKTLLKFAAEQAPGCNPGRITGWCLPQASSEDAYESSLSGDNWLLVGDAAGHADPFTGEGIIYAMWGAEIAARCILEGRSDQYDDQWREAFYSRLLKHLKMAAMLEKKFTLEAILATGRLPILGKWLYETLISPPKK